VENESKDFDLNTYLDYSYSDFFMYIMTFPGEIEVLGLDQSTLAIDNDFGKYLFDIKTSSSNKIIIQSNYVISKDRIPKEEQEKIEEINNQLKEITNKRLLLKIKNT
jgi:hypothetical protein